MTHVSVMVPVYNRANLIGYTLDCLIAQSHKDIDITVIDDASTDDTLKVVENYFRDPRVKLIKNQENLGLTKNWNRCLDLAKGPLVQIMQSDDMIDEDYLTRVNGIFEMHPDVGFVSATCRHIDAKGEVTDCPPDKPDGFYKAGDEAVTAILTLGHPHVSSIIMRKTDLDQIGRIDEEIWHGPDIEFDTRMASRLNYYKIGKVCTSFRRHGTNRGNLEFFRKDYLANHVLKYTLAYGYLSEKGRAKLGIRNLSAFVNENAAQIAISGAILMVPYGKFDLGRFYLWKAIELNPISITKLRFWKALGLNLFQGLGQKVMIHRLNITSQDLAIIKGSKLQ